MSKKYPLYHKIIIEKRQKVRYYVIVIAYIFEKVNNKITQNQTEDKK